MVKEYRSVIVIKYDDLDKPGFTYLLTYHDDVSKVLPRVFTRWANGAGARSSHDKIVSKTKQIFEERTKLQTSDMNITNQRMSTA